MKIVCDGDTVSLYMNNIYIKNLDFSDKIFLESYLKNTLKILDNKYNLKFDGYYDVNLYIDQNYGVIIDVIKERLEYFDYFSNQIQLNINVIEDCFLYELLDIPFHFMDNLKFYKFFDKIYVKIKGQIDNFLVGNLFELSNVIYGEEKNKILNFLKKVG